MSASSLGEKMSGKRAFTREFTSKAFQHSCVLACALDFPLAPPSACDSCARRWSALMKASSMSAAANKAVSVPSDSTPSGKPFQPCSKDATSTKTQPSGGGSSPVPSMSSTPPTASMRNNSRGAQESVANAPSGMELNTAESNTTNLTRSLPKDAIPR